jgi:hypothetical protein
MGIAKLTPRTALAWSIVSLVGATVAVSAPSAQAGFGVSKWEAGTCKVTSCVDKSAHPQEEFYTQAAGHPNFGITDFAFNTVNGEGKEPEGSARDVRVDLPPGLSVDPEAVEQCTEVELDASKCPAGSEVGEDEATGTMEVLGLPVTKTEHFPVYDMVRKPGEPARFGVEILVEVAGMQLVNVRSYLEGGISWHHEPETSESSGVATGDYHEFFEIKELPKAPKLVESKLIFWGKPHEHNAAAPNKTFLTMPSTCDGPQVTTLHVDSYEAPGQFLVYKNPTPVGATGCGSLAFEPSLALNPASKQPDVPAGMGALLDLPQFTEAPDRTSSPDLQSAEVALPAGMTLNPAAAHGLEACTDAEIGLGSDEPIGCPAGSKLGSLTVDAPGIPNGSLTGSVYLGTQESMEPESGREYRIFLAAEAPQYGVGVRLEGQVKANRETGRLTARIENGPQVPFEDFALQLNGGPRAPLANPLTCGTAKAEASLTPYTGEPPTVALGSFVLDSNGAGGPCPSPPPFALVQSATPSSTQAGAYTAFTFDLTRTDGQQYLAKLRTVLPPGLLGAISAVPLCGEPQAAQGTCSAASEIGIATVTVGAGSEPYPFTGKVYLTGPYEGAPYGLSIPVSAQAGPFDLGTVVTRAAIGVEPYTARVTATSALPTIVGGVPLRLKTLSVAVTRPNFMFNPTSCSPLASETTLTSTFAATQGLASPFQVNGCGSLPFSPKLKAATNAKTSSRVDGASFEVDIAQGARQADLHEVLMTLPKQLPARLSTLRKACPAAMFETGPPPGTCLSTAKVGEVTVSTPVLPGKLSGPIYMVSHGGEAFPDVDMIVKGDGVEVVLVGHTHISSAGVTTSNFESLPDVPISSVAVSLPVGPLSLLSAHGALCGGRALLAPTTLVSQSGKTITQKTKIVVAGCPVRITGHRVAGTHATLTVQTPGAGSVTVGGSKLQRLAGGRITVGGGPQLRGLRARHLSRARKFKLRVSLTPAAVAALQRLGKLKVRVRVRFTPRSGGGASVAFVTAVFRAPPRR